jgi:hypothetical protein
VRRYQAWLRAVAALGSAVWNGNHEPLFGSHRGAIGGLADMDTGGRLRSLKP